MKHIKKFNNNDSLDSYKKSNFITPHLYLNTDVRTIDYMPKYKQLEYISSTSTGGQYINLGCKLLENTDDIHINIKFNIKDHGKTGIQQSTFIASQPEVNPYPGFTMRIPAVDKTSISNSVTLQTKWMCSKDWGTYYESSKQRWCCLYMCPRKSTGQPHMTDGTFTELNQVYEYSITLDNIPSSQINDFNCHLFCALNSSNMPYRFVEADLYYLKFTKGNKVIRNLIPVQKISTDEIGLYDIENDHFYVSQGDEPFVAGPII